MPRLVRSLPRWAWAAVVAGAVVAAVPAVLLASFRAGPAAAPVALLPDLQQRAPYDLTGRTVGTGTHRRFLLAFASAVDNVGVGPLLVVGRRSARRAPVMGAEQLVRRSDGSTWHRGRVGILRYTRETTHQHWHYLDFERYELRRVAARRPVRPDRKTGFCLGDRYESDPMRRLPREPERAVWVGECGRDRPDLLVVREGISVGYGDDYKPFLEGQHIDITGIPAGRYELIHRVNPARELRESSFGNNDASIVLHLSWPRGRRSSPRIDVVARCGDGRRCRAR